MRFAACLLFAFSLLPSGFARGAELTLPPKEKLHIYLLIGQSNMAGRGAMSEDDRTAPERILKLDKHGDWVPGSDPLHFDKPQIAGVGPGSGFGPALAAADESATIGLVPCSFGGTPLARWVKGGDLYANAVKRAQIAMRTGTLKGVIWHQGESDASKPETAETYGRRLEGMIAALRKDLDAPELPVVVGELGRFLDEVPSLPHFESVNEQLNALPERVPHTACVSSNGLQAKTDKIHFDADSAREFGRRYAKAMLDLQNAQ